METWRLLVHTNRRDIGTPQTAAKVQAVFEYNQKNFKYDREMRQAHCAKPDGQGKWLTWCERKGMKHLESLAFVTTRLGCSGIGWWMWLDVIDAASCAKMCLFGFLYKHVFRLVAISDSLAPNRQKTEFKTREWRNAQCDLWRKFLSCCDGQGGKHRRSDAIHCVFNWKWDLQRFSLLLFAFLILPLMSGVLRRGVFFWDRSDRI